MAKHSFVKVGALQAHLDDVLLPVGLVLGSIDIYGADIKLESHPVSVTMPKKAQFEAKLRAADLASYLNDRGPEGLKNFRVTTGGGQINVDATKTVLVDVPVKAVCKLRIRDQTQIHVEVVSIHVMGSGATNFLQSLIEKINPVLDADDFPVDAVFEQISIEEGVIVVTGRLAPKG